MGRVAGQATPSKPATAPEVGVSEVRPAGPDEHPKPMTFGTRLRRLRQQLGLSQADLAGDSLSASAISLLETGRREPSLQTAEIVAQRLGCSVEYLRNGVERTSGIHAVLGLFRAEISMSSGDMVVARRQFRRAVADNSLRHHLRIRARLGGALVAQTLGEFDNAIIELESIRNGIVGKGQQHSGWLIVDSALARCYHAVGRRTESLRIARNALPVMESLGMVGLAAHSELLLCLTRELVMQREVTEAVRQVEQSIETPIVLVDLERPRRFSNGLKRALEAGRDKEAMMFAERTLAAYADIADSRAAARLVLVACLLLMDFSSIRNQLLKDALTRARTALRILGADDDAARCEVGLAQVAASEERFDDCVSHADLACTTLRPGPSPELARALLLLSQAYERCQRPALAATCLESAAAMLGELPRDSSTLRSWRELGALFRTRNRDGEALEAYEQALVAAGLTAACAPSSEINPHG
jgi:tetratricopeptide (TPR) repeat protein